MTTHLFAKNTIYEELLFVRNRSKKAKVRFTPAFAIEHPYF